MKCSVSFAAFIVVVAFETRLCSTPEATAWNYQPKSISFSKSTRASRSHTSNSTNTFRIERNLFICGDISPSPGQERTRSKPTYLWWMYKNCTNTKTRYCVLAILVGHMPNACSYLNQPSSIICSTKKSNGHVTLNINSVRNKFAEIKERLVSNAFAILSVQETKIDRSFPNIQFHVNDYNLFLW